MSDDDERRPLVASEAFSAVTAAQTAAHPWLAGAIQAVWDDPARDPRDAFICFFVDPDPGEVRAWRLVGVGRVREHSSGRPSPLHLPGRTRGGLYRHTWGLTYYVTWWDGERAYLIETWELRVERADQTAVGHLRWRPGYAEPRMGVDGVQGLGHTRREALEREIWAFLEPRSPAGRKERRRPDPGFLRDLERAVERLIVRNTGSNIRQGDWLQAMEYKKDTYSRRLKEWGLTPEQVRAWVRHCVQDYWRRGAPTEGWRLPVRLSELAPRDFCD